MQISVLIPSHRAQNTLQACLDSINKAAVQAPDVDIEVIILAHNQHYNNLDIAIPHTIEEIEDPDFKISIGALRNMLIDRATKEYILFVDSDDAIYPAAFNEFAKYEGHDVIQGISNVMDTPYKALDWNFCTNICIKKDRVPCKFPEWSLYEDEMFDVHVRTLNDIVAVSEYTYFYTEHSGIDGSKTGSISGTREEFLLQFRSLIKICEELNDAALETRLQIVLELLLDHMTNCGQDMACISSYLQYKEYKRKRCSSRHNAMISNHLIEEDQEVVMDLIIDGGEYQHDFQHRTIPLEALVQSTHDLQPAFYVDKRCNKNCNYCKQKTFDIPQRTDKQILADFQKAYYYIKGIATQIQPRILGGEPTLWSDELTQGIINTIRERTYWLFTNGYNTDSPFYKDERATIVQHITDWEDRPVIKRVNDRVQFIIVAERDKTEELIKYLNTDFPEEYKGFVFIQPCRSTNPEKASTLQQLKDIYDRTGIKCYRNECLGATNKQQIEARERCFCYSRQPQIYCDTQTYTPCCAPDFYDPIPLTMYGSNMSQFAQNCRDCCEWIHSDEAQKVIEENK